MIAPGFVLTAAHNITNNNGVLNVTQVTVAPVSISTSSLPSASPFGTTTVTNTANFIVLDSDYNEAGDYGDDVALIEFNMTPAMNIGLATGGIDIAPMVIFVDASDAIGMSGSLSLTGMAPLLAAGPTQGFTNAHFGTGFFGSATPYNFFTSSGANVSGEYFTISGLDTEAGVSGAGYFSDFNVPGTFQTANGVAAVHSGEPSTPVVTVLDAEHYANISAALLGNVTALQVPRVTIIADQDAGGMINGTFLHENMHGSSEFDIMFGNEGNDKFFLQPEFSSFFSMPQHQNDVAIGGAGVDTAVYNGSLSNFTIEAMSFGIGYTVSYTYSYRSNFYSPIQKGTKTDTLIDVEQIEIGGVTYQLSALAPSNPFDPFDPFNPFRGTNPTDALDNDFEDGYEIDSFSEPMMIDTSDAFEFYEIA